MSTDKDPARSIRWRRIVAEGTAVVVSILLAFSIDAWWDELQESRETAVVVQALASDIETAREALRHGTMLHTQSRDAAMAWRTVDQTTPQDSMMSWVSRALFQRRTPNLTLGTVTAFLSSGSLASVEDRELRAWISSWPGIKEDFDEEMDAAEHFIQFVVPAYFVDRDVLIDSTMPPQLVGDASFWNLMVQASTIHRIFVREAELVMGSLDQGLELARGSSN